MSETKEVDDMPRRDGTGPMGLGAMSGRGVGPCATGEQIQYGLGYRQGFGRGCGRRLAQDFDRGFYNDQLSTKTKKEILAERHAQLTKQLEVINKQIAEE